MNHCQLAFSTSNGSEGHSSCSFIPPYLGETEAPGRRERLQPGTPPPPLGRALPFPSSLWEGKAGHACCVCSVHTRMHVVCVRACCVSARVCHMVHICVHVCVLCWACELCILSVCRGLLSGDKGLLEALRSQGALRRGKASLILHFLQKKVARGSSCAFWEKFGRMLAIWSLWNPRTCRIPLKRSDWGVGSSKEQGVQK